MADQVDKVSADVRYDASGVDVAAYCRLGLGSGIAQLGVAWGQGGASLSIMGEEGHISFVFDEHMGYYGAPARAVRLFSGRRALPQLVHAAPCRTFFTPELFEDIAATIDGYRQTVIRPRARTGATRSRLFCRLPVGCDTGSRRAATSTRQLYNNGLAGLQEARSSPTRGERTPYFRTTQGGKLCSTRKPAWR